MMIIEILLYLGILIILYSYFGYGIVALVLRKVKVIRELFPLPYNSIPSKQVEADDFFPTVSLIISASGESSQIIIDKIENTIGLIYPKEKLEIIFALAFDPKNKVDETFDEYYNQQIDDKIESGASPKEEELYIKFMVIENLAASNKKEAIEKLESLLKSDYFDSDGLSSGNKDALDDRMTEGALSPRIYVTKDIVRKGKFSQVKRSVTKASGSIIVFSDANSMFNAEALIEIVKHFRDQCVGCVSGEKRVLKSADSTSDEGEGLYWKYESFLKKLDSDIYSAVGAAGEIFAVRKSLWDDSVPNNAIIEDFVVSLRIAQQGYRIRYEPNAYAQEEPTKDLKSEFIRRRRISSGGFQAIVWLKAIMNPFKYGILSFLFVSHRVLRWAVVPFLLPIVLLLNILALMIEPSGINTALIVLQIVFYVFSGIGYILETKRIKVKVFYFPYTLLMMNIAALAGFNNYRKGNLNPVWERVNR